MVRVHLRRRHKIVLLIAGIAILVSLLIPYIQSGFSRLGQELKKQGQYYEPKDIERGKWMEQQEQQE